MTQISTTTPTKTPSVKEILSTIAFIEWEKSGNHQEAPVPSPDDLEQSRLLESGEHQSIRSFNFAFFSSVYVTRYNYSNPKDSRNMGDRKRDKSKTQASACPRHPHLATGTEREGSRAAGEEQHKDRQRRSCARHGGNALHSF